MRSSTQRQRQAYADQIIERVAPVVAERDYKCLIAIEVPWGVKATTLAKLRARFPEHVVRVRVARS